MTESPRSTSPPIPGGPQGSGPKGTHRPPQAVDPIGAAPGQASAVRPPGPAPASPQPNRGSCSAARLPAGAGRGGRISQPAGSHPPSSGSRARRPGPSAGASQACSSPSGRSTGMRSWRGRIRPLAAVVITQQLSTSLPSAPIQRSHRPASQNGPPSRRRINRRFSKKPSAGSRQRRWRQGPRKLAFWGTVSARALKGRWAARASLLHSGSSPQSTRAAWGWPCSWRRTSTGSPGAIVLRGE